MKLNIAVLAGDGIGPEIMKQGVAVMQAIAEKFNHEFTYNEAICGAHAIDEVGDPFPEETFKTCMDADAVLFAAVGDPRFDNNPTAKVRPSRACSLCVRSWASSPMFAQWLHSIACSTSHH